MQTKNIEEIKNIVEQKQNAIIEVNEIKMKEIEENLKDINDFRSLAEKITNPINDLVIKTSKIIEQDPILDVSNELTNINGEIQKIYKDIINNEHPILKQVKKIPFLGEILENIQEKIEETKFNLKSTREKIETIFQAFDISYESLQKSIDIQYNFLNSLEQNISDIKAYQKYLDNKLSEFKKEYENTKEEKYKLFIDNMEQFIRNLDVLVGNLELTRKRLLIRLDSAVKLGLNMNASRPIFQTLLSVALIETSGQKAIEASTKAMQTMGETIDQMSKDLTERTIQTHKKVEEMTSKPILKSEVFIENVKKLKEHFDTIEIYKEQIRKEAEEEKMKFKEALQVLEGIKNIKAEDIKNLENSL